MCIAKLGRTRAGFTLIELMVVVLIIAILMSVMFRLSGLGDDTDRKNTTIARLQKIENCLSGYYAVYGSYPPVPLQGVSRNINMRVDDYGIQDGSGMNSSLNWEQVKAACKAQPVGAIYPYSEDLNDYVEQISAMMKEMHGKDYPKFNRGFINASRNANGLFNASVQNNGSSYRGQSRRFSPDWNDCQLFRYGLLSFLLPRYLFMMSGDASFYSNDRYTQWCGFNKRPCKVEDGTRYDSWDQVRGKMYSGKGSQASNNRSDRAEIEALPSQSVCRRWLVNLEGIVTEGGTFYGIDTRDHSRPSSLRVDNVNIPLYESNGQQYVLGEMRVEDGWDEDIYYYSEPPYQSYRLWSAGPNRKTFPPWISLDSLPTADRKTAAAWMADDIIMLSN